MAAGHACDVAALNHEVLNHAVELRAPTARVGEKGGREQCDTSTRRYLATLVGQFRVPTAQRSEVCTRARREIEELDHDAPLRLAVDANVEIATPPAVLVGDQ